ncbi:MAG: NACHT domain-containing protein [Acidobacteriota bacterium]
MGLLASRSTEATPTGLRRRTEGRRVLDSLDPTGLIDAIRASFKSVFSEFNSSSEAHYQALKVRTVNAERYASYLATRVGTYSLFGTGRNVPVGRSYVRLTLSSGAERLVYRSSSEIEHDIGRQRGGTGREGVDPWTAIERTVRGFALQGGAGSGKTTALRHLAVTAAAGRPARGRRRVPILLSVRDYAGTEGEVWGAAAGFLGDVGIEPAEAVLQALAVSGALMLLVDGLDETDGQHQARIVRELERIVSRYPHSLICLSARPLSLDVALPGFDKWETLPLALPERIDFIRKWFSLVDEGKGERLIERIDGEPAMLDLGGTPLLLSIVCALYENDLDVPSEPDELYVRCVEGLLGGWDAFRNIARESPLAALSVRKRHIIASWLAAELFEAGRVAFDVRDVDGLGVLSRVAEFLGCSGWEAGDVLASLFGHFGLLVERSPAKYSFVHLSLHEFLVAQYVVGNRRERELVWQHFREERWSDVIVLVARLLPNADDFLVEIEGAARSHHVADVELVLRVVDARPASSLPVRRRLGRHFALCLAGAFKSLPGHRLHLEGTDLIVTSATGWGGLAARAKKVHLAQRAGDGAGELAHVERSSVDRAKSKGRRPKSVLEHNASTALYCTVPILKMLDLCQLGEESIPSAPLFQLLSGGRRVERVFFRESALGPEEVNEGSRQVTGGRRNSRGRKPRHRPRRGDRPPME